MEKQEHVVMTDSQMVGYLMMLSTELQIAGRDIMAQACGQAAGRILLLPASLTSWTNKVEAE